ncbi:MAG: class I SAM-dependent methyltransferase [Candidatus Marinimicrobia bacterium]|jgi:2-polyprenyl-3-methyl-5-hydroxy-6-metoxy-1,4-benzoquinol methylase|nr:class I SAM-dependent methyltransferase [Candidatus Neomarinimicrobiota bacterium]MBT3632978.1 class I SAM-dependent methyltransferase [Candidatus Neomarinimicrobiota bacterium]MBT3682088.1 class I SAM-dependent methyltransferase [Candidatus Neomarinimicrobiota bacterium]MBT3758883.1 class I SAM-dependent methyltransferase [Candidatus Neomarinimicrobiota bacterium]MBT3895218.1 class I SAM-dependent methyltransferase [Candidatus Neomarinimicrobiota bacterium]
MNKWDVRYDLDEYVYGKDPNIFLSENSGIFSGKNILSLGEGEGRNAVYLAKCGFNVTAVDSSIVALKKAQNLSRENDVSLTTICEDLSNFTIGCQKWDGIISIFCHTSPDLRSKILKNSVAGLRQNGIFLLEAYTKDQLNYNTGGPRVAALMMSLQQLKCDLSELDIIHGVELIRKINEGSLHCGTSAVVQILAIKRRPQK